MSQELTVVNNKEMFAPTKEDYLNMQVGEPKNMLEVRALANFLTRSKFIPQAFRGDLNTAVMLIVTCKQYGLPITALSEVMEVNGKVGFWGRTKLGIVLKSGVCEYIIPTEQTDKKCTVETQRKGWPKPVSVTYTLDQAEKAGLIARSDAWKKHPSDMLYWRAVSRIISQVYPDVIQGFATVEEEEERPQEAEIVEAPREIEMPKPKRSRKVKAVEVKAEEHEEDKPETIEIPHPVFPSDEELEATGIKPKEELFEGNETESTKQPLPEPKRYVREVKQVMIKNGDRYLVAKNPIAPHFPDDEWIIPTAGMASELKKLTGSKVYIFSDGKTVFGYEEYKPAH